LAINRLWGGLDVALDGFAPPFFILNSAFFLRPSVALGGFAFFILPSLEWCPIVQKVDSEPGGKGGHIHRRYTVGTRLMVAVQSLCPRHFLANAETGALFGPFRAGDASLATIPPIPWLSTGFGVALMSH
jgi:hypothetical protein